MKQDIGNWIGDRIIGEVGTLGYLNRFSNREVLRDLQIAAKHMYLGVANDTVVEVGNKVYSTMIFL